MHRATVRCDPRRGVDLPSLALAFAFALLFLAPGAVANVAPGVLRPVPALELLGVLQQLRR